MDSGENRSRTTEGRDDHGGAKTANDRLPLISIVMSAYNAERFIEETIASILRQTLDNFECIVVNDGSTDSTPRIVEKFLTDPRMVLVNLPKVGLCAALNHALSIARAPVVARMDADDVMFPERLERQLQFLRQHPDIGGCGSFYHLIDKDGALIGDGRSPLTSVQGIMKHLQNHGHLIYPNPTVMFHRDVVRSLGGYRSQYFPCEDVDLFVRMLDMGKPIVIMPNYLLYFRAHQGSLSANNAEKQFHINNLIFANYQARKRGDSETPIEQYLSDIKAATGVKKLVNWCQVQSFILHRRAARATTDKRKLLGKGLMLMAMALNPHDAYWKVLRKYRANFA